MYSKRQIAGKSVTLEVSNIFTIGIIYYFIYSFTKH